MKNKHQHFIPQTYLKKFAHTRKEDKYFVDAYDKILKKHISDISVKNICVETDLYTLKHLGDKDKFKIENFFSNSIESKFPNVYNILVKQKKEFINMQEREDILYTTLSMYFRTPKVLNNFVEFILKIHNDVNDNIKLINFLGYDIDINCKEFSELRKIIKEKNRLQYIKTQLYLLDEFVKFKKFDGIVVLELIGDQEFITSDNPVDITSHLGGFNLFDSNNSIYVTLDHKHALYIAPKNEQSIINQVTYQKDNFNQHLVLNHSVYDNAERWIIGSKNGINQFLKDFNQNMQVTDQNHPSILVYKEKISIIQELIILMEKGVSNQNVELVNKLKEIRTHRLYEKHIDLQEMYKKIVDIGIDIDF
jgi:hypothetical protein